MKRNTMPVVILFSTIASSAGEQIELSWHSIDGGGVMYSNGGVFELSGTIGQPDADIMNGGPFRLTGGFWFETPPGDCNEDGAVNLLDHLAFVDCLTGPAAGVLISCKCFNTNQDGTVDLRDFAAGQIVFSGS